MFLLQYYVDKETSTKDALNKAKIKGALDIDVRRILSFETPRDGWIALMSTASRYRPSQMRRALTATKYNEVDRGGLQIKGDDGLKIYTRSKLDASDDRDLFITYMGMVRQLCKEQSLNFKKILNTWPDLTQSKTGPVEPDADDLLAMNDGGDNGDDDDDDDANDDGSSTQLAGLKARNAQLEQEVQAARATIRALASAAATSADTRA